MKAHVIIPAAGLGTRMASGTGEKPGRRRPAASKQFTTIAGAPILVHTLRRFARVAGIESLWVAIRGEDEQRLRESLAGEEFAARVRLAPGGDNRQESVASALAALKADEDDLVLVHDAVRPFVDEEIITSVMQAATQHGAAIAGLPATDTVKQVSRTAEGAIITSTIPRERVVLAQTPQGFRFGLLKRAFDEAAAVGFTGTDEASLVERLGETVAVVMGSARNIKITTPADLELAEFLFAQELRRTANLTG